MFGQHLLSVLNNGALHKGPWIWIWCRLGVQIQRPLHLHTTSIQIRAACYAASDSEWDPVQQCNAHSLRGIWSSCETTLNPDWGSGSSEYGFSVHVESPNKPQTSWSMTITLSYQLMTASQHCLTSIHDAFVRHVVNLLKTATQYSPANACCTLLKQSYPEHFVIFGR